MKKFSSLRQVLLEAFGPLLGWIYQDQQVLKLALRAEASARRLNKTSPISASKYDLVKILQATCCLLEQVLDHSETLLSKDDIYSSIANFSTSANAKPESSLASSVEANQHLTSTQELKLSGTLKELINLRDWILLAQSGENVPKSDALEAFYKKLGQVLAKENVIEIEDIGIFNYERQRVVSTKLTDTREKDNCVYETVRPGYLFHGELIRPQEVVVYTYRKQA